MGLAAAALLMGVVVAPAAEPKRGGTLTFTYQPEPSALSTIATTAVPVALVSTKIFESLLEYKGPELSPGPGLAKSWMVGDDGKTYTFKLRSDVKWHDGKPFTSEDVKFSVEKLVRPFHSRGKVYFGELDAVDTPDPHTVVFKLKKPVPFFLKAFQPSETPIMPKHILGAPGCERGAERAPVGVHAEPDRHRSVPLQGMEEGKPHHARAQ